MFDVLDWRELLLAEARQLDESGYEPALGAEELARLADSAVPECAELEAAYVSLAQSKPRAGADDVSPESLEEIEAMASPSPAEAVPPGRADDGLLAAWLGRCAGCNLGKPVEGFGWNRRKLRRYLEAAGAYPIADYLPVLDPMPDGLVFNPAWRETTRGRVQAMARDDDLDYTVLGLELLERRGTSFSTADVGELWLELLPFSKTYTAERAAYRNLVRGLAPPQTATYRNPYREWIGAMIRADIFGYVCPGDPGAAARLAYRDATLSHTGNGVYGAMWAAALVAAAFCADSPSTAIERSLSVIPPGSRLARAVRDQLDAYSRGIGWDDAMACAEQRLGHYHWIHAINNASVVAAALLWGDGDFMRTVGYAVEGGLDTDCTGATAGSVCGALVGTAALPEQLVAPLEDTLHSAVFGYEPSRISELARRTAALRVG